MKLFPIVFLLAVAAGEALGEICNSQKTPTKLIARRTWPSQIATTTTTAKPTTTITTSTTTTKATTTTLLPILFNCSVDKPACGNMCTNLTSSGGVVQSPNFPGDYGNEDRRCKITITAPVGWMIQLNFTTFNVEIDKAYVTVSGAMGIPILGGTSGNEIPGVVATTNAVMSIGFFSFVSDKPSTVIYNWQATFSVSQV